MKRDNLPRLQPDLLLPEQVIHPHTRSGEGLQRMTGSRHHPASAADLAPPPMRPGSERAHELPSRIGDQLHYRDGRIVHLNHQEQS